MAAAQGDDLRGAVLREVVVDARQELAQIDVVRQVDELDGMQAGEPAGAVVYMAQLSGIPAIQAGRKVDEELGDDALVESIGLVLGG